jgi:hypothetical protein
MIEGNVFIEFTGISSTPKHTKTKIAVRAGLVDTIREADDDHILVGGAACVYCGPNMYVTVESYDELMSKFFSTAKESTK